MKIIFYLMILFIFILILILGKEYKLNKIMTFLCSILIIKIASNPKLSIIATLNGAKLFFNSVFVSLFPFLVITNIIMCYDGITIYSKLLGNILCMPFKLPKQCSFPILVSAICGYPLGAKSSCDLYEKKLIDRDTFERLINIASNGSPIFIIGTVGVSMLKDHNLGYILLISNYISCILMALLIKKKTCNNFISTKKLENYCPKENIGSILKKSIESSLYTVLSIGGFIVLFSVIIALVKTDLGFNYIINSLCALFKISSNVLNGLILGMLEMTNGCSIISTSEIPLITKLILLSFFISFSGFSIISQVYSFIYKYDFPIKKYINRKLLQGILSSIVTVFLYEFLYSHKSTSTFKYLTYINTNRLNNIIFILALTILVIPCLIYNTKKLFHIS